MILLMLFIFNLLIKILLVCILLIKFVLLLLKVIILFFFMIKIFFFVIFIFLVKYVCVFCIWNLLCMGIKYFGFIKFNINFNFFWLL